MDGPLVRCFSNNRNARGTADRSSARDRVVFCCKAIWRWFGWRRRRRSSRAWHGCNQRVATWTGWHLHVQCFAQMRNETFTEFDGIPRGQMRPFGTIESGELGKIGVINPGRTRHFQKRIPGFFARRQAVLEFFQPTAVWKPNENNLSTARPDFFYGSSHVSKTFLDCFIHLREENLFRDVSGRRRWREQRNPDLLDLLRQLAPRFSAFLPHPRATIPIYNLKVGRKTRWH